VMNVPVASTLYRPTMEVIYFHLFHFHSHQQAMYAVSCVGGFSSLVLWVSSSLLNATVTRDLYNVLLHGIKFVSMSVACERGERTNRIIKHRELINNDVFK
jgi:hypothetical protein